MTQEQREALLAFYRDARGRLKASLDRLTDAQMVERSLGEWSVKDILLHIAAWDEARVGEALRRVFPVGLADHRVEPALAQVQEQDALLDPPAHQRALAAERALHAVLEDAHGVHELADQGHAVGGGVAGAGDGGRGEGQGCCQEHGSRDESMGSHAAGHCTRSPC